MSNIPPDPRLAYVVAVERIEACRRRGKKGKWLNLDKLDLCFLPPEIGQLTSLTTLHLSGNHLNYLPPEIGQLAALTELHLSDNMLETLPPEIGRLTALTELHLANNDLNTLPPEMGRLTALTELYLGGNNLNTWPPPVAGLTGLTKLSLYRCGLKALPPEIGQLSKLNTLQLTGNELRTLPPEIGKLTALTMLQLTGNELHELPAEIGRLTSLSELYLGDNRLLALPREIAQLVALRLLYLFDNRLHTLPREIGQLKRLAVLALENNQLTTLPLEIGQLINLKALRLHDNISLGIPPSVLGPSAADSALSGVSLAKPSDILDYYFSTVGQAGRALREVKVILVGRGEVGKSSMVDVLQKRKFVKNRKRTDGIAINSWEVELKDGRAELLVWDFGGQEIMHGTHQFFLTHRSLYVVIVDGRHDRGRQDAEYWLKLVRAFGGDSPVMVVMNRQKGHPFSIDMQMLAQKYGVSLDYFFRTDCSDSKTIDPLRRAILSESQRMLKAEERFPVKCWDLKTRLGQMKEHGDDYLSQVDYEQLCKEHGITAEEAQQKLLRRLADLGTVVSFPDDVKMAELSVLNPGWATEGIYRVVTNDGLRDKKHGLLTLKNLRELLPKDRWPNTQHVRYVLDLMAKFDLCFPVDKDGDPVLVPELLPDKTPPLGDWEPSKCVVFQYQYPVLPHGVLPRFTTRTHELSQGRTRWRSGVELSFEGAEARVQADYDDNTITVWLRGRYAADRRSLLKIIQQHFHAIHARIEGLGPKEFVAVPGWPEVLVSYSDAAQDERLGETTFTVTINGDRVKVPIGELLNGVASSAERRAMAQRLEKQALLQVFQGDVFVGDKVVGDKDGSKRINLTKKTMIDKRNQSIIGSQIGGRGNNLEITNSQVGETLDNCTLTIQQEPSAELRSLLEQLDQEVRDLVAKLPEEKQSEAAGDLEQLVKAVTSTPPVRRWYSVSTEGLLDAAKYVKDFTGNIAGTLNNVSKLVFGDES